MGIHWKLKTYVATRHGLYRVTDLQRRIVKRAGILISLTNLSNYLEKKPKTLRLATIEALCTALECRLVDFCDVTPAKSCHGGAEPEIRKLSYQNTPHSKRAVSTFPDPKDYSP